MQRRRGKHHGPFGIKVFLTTYGRRTDNAGMGSVAGGRLERGTLEVAGVWRGYWLARGPQATAAGAAAGI